ncbi:MAG: lysophospholipase [Cellulosilyticaceae bacterium]
MRKSEFVVENKQDGHQIQAYQWLPDANVQVKGSVQLVHGSCEHAKRYENFARFLTTRGYSVYAHDHRGHGRSVTAQIPLGYFGEHDGWEHLVADCVCMNTWIKENNNDKKIVMLGHSMGSFIARAYAIAHSETIDGLILSGTAHYTANILELGTKMANRAIAKGKGKEVHRILDRMSYGTFHMKFYKEKDRLAWLSSDPYVREVFRKDPLCGFKFTAGAFRDMFGGLAVITDMTQMKKMRRDLPIFIVSGEEDPVGNFGKGVKKTYVLMKEAGIKDIEMKLYPGMRHEILNEKRRQEVYKDVLGWLQKIM